jgi:hypothetical protein
MKIIRRIKEKDINRVAGEFAAELIFAARREGYLGFPRGKDWTQGSKGSFQDFLRGLSLAPGAPLDFTKIRPY